MTGLTATPASAQPIRTAVDVSAPAVKTEEEATPFRGLWRSNFGLIRLCQIGKRVEGAYQFNGVNRLSGTIGSDGRLTFRYSEASGATGEGQFRVTDGGKALTGQWRTGEKDAWKSWNATRQMPTPGLKWLVVLEENWETGIAEPEYSYGEMLRAFFRRAPNVEVRHRFFHSYEDLRRFCEEVPFLAEPTVVYISSHGNTSGVLAGNTVIPAAKIGKALQGADNVLLLHLGACDLMQGKGAQAIRNALNGTATFPISGYANSAGWAESAVADFLYLELVLVRQRTPAEAVKVVRQSVTFTAPAPATASTQQPNRGAALASAVLEIFP